MGLLDPPVSFAINQKVPNAVVKAGNTADLISKVAGGGLVFVPAGTYVVSATLSIPSGTTLIGEGERTVIKLANGSTTVNPIIAVGSVGGAVVPDVAIRNIKVDGNKANQSTLCIGIDVVTGLRVQVTGCHVDGVNGYNFHASVGASEVIFDGNLSTNSFKEGFETQGGSRITFSNNIVESAGYNGILVWANSAGGYTCTDVVISGNIVRGYGTATAAHGIRVDDGAQNVTVVGNVVGAGVTAGGCGIIIGSDAAPAVQNVTVVGNTVNGALSDGIRVGAYASEVTVGDNIVIGSGTNGIEVTGANATGVLVRGNQVVGSANTGIYVNSAATEVTVSGNRVKGSAQDGIWFNAIVGGAITDNTCHGNGLTSTGYSGIRLEPSTAVPAGQLLVANNRCRLNGRDGINIKDNSDVLITGNYCVSNGKQATSRAGILVFAAFAPVDGIFIRGNRCTDKQATKTQYYGIFLTGLGSSTNIVVANNDVKGNATNDASSGGIGGGQVYDSAPFHRLASQTVGTTQVSVPHGLPYAPRSVVVTMTSAGQVWQSAAADTTNVYLTADAAGRTVDILVG